MRFSGGSCSTLSFAGVSSQLNTRCGGEVSRLHVSLVTPHCASHAATTKSRGKNEATVGKTWQIDARIKIPRQSTRTWDVRRMGYQRVLHWCHWSTQCHVVHNELVQRAKASTDRRQSDVEEHQLAHLWQKLEWGKGV